MRPRRRYLPGSAVGQGGRLTDRIVSSRVGGDARNPIEVVSQRSARRDAAVCVAADHPRGGDLGVSQRRGETSAPGAGSLPPALLEFLRDERRGDRDLVGVAGCIAGSLRRHDLARLGERAGGRLGSHHDPGNCCYDRDHEADRQRDRQAAIVHTVIV